MTPPLTDDGWIERFEAFARSKPADERYCEYDARACALAQFGYPYVALSNHAKFGIPYEAYAASTHRGPFTFGALANRLARLRTVKP